LGKYLDKNHHHCAPFNISPIKPSLGKLGENPQKKTISLPPFCVSRKRFESVTNPS
jgi:hypothetical protein